MNGESKGKIAIVKKVTITVISLRYGEMYVSGRGEYEQAFVAQELLDFQK